MASLRFRFQARDLPACDLPALSPHSTVRKEDNDSLHIRRYISVAPNAQKNSPEIRKTRPLKTLFIMSFKEMKKKKK